MGMAEIPSNSFIHSSMTTSMTTLQTSLEQSYSPVCPTGTPATCTRSCSCIPSHFSAHELPCDSAHNLKAPPSTLRFCTLHSGCHAFIGSRCCRNPAAAIAALHPRPYLLANPGSWAAAHPSHPPCPSSPPPCSRLCSPPACSCM